MKSVKIYLIIVSLLLIGALAAGVYVWYVVLKTQGQLESQMYQAPQAEQPGEGRVDTEPSAPEDEVVTTIEIDSLSDTQQTAIRTLGFEGENFEVTTGMVICAEDAIGKERFDAIIGGAAPSPLESLKLLPCFKK